MSSGQPDWYSNFTIHSKHNSNYLPIAVDGNGRLITMLKALDGVIPRDIKVDADGNLTMNIKSQDKSEITTRDKYGAAQILYWTNQIINPGERKWLEYASGKGITLGGMLRARAGGTLWADVLEPQLDERPINLLRFYDIFSAGMIRHHTYPIVLTLVDDVSQEYIAIIKGGYTFEKYYDMYYTHNGPTPALIDYVFTFALL